MRTYRTSASSSPPRPAPSSRRPGSSWGAWSTSPPSRSAETPSTAVRTSIHSGACCSSASRGARRSIARTRSRPYTRTSRSLHRTRRTHARMSRTRSQPWSSARWPSGPKTGSRRRARWALGFGALASQRTASSASSCTRRRRCAVAVIAIVALVAIVASVSGDDVDAAGSSSSPSIVADSLAASLAHADAESGEILSTTPDLPRPEDAFPHVEVGEGKRVGPHFDPAHPGRPERRLCGWRHHDARTAST